MLQSMELQRVGHHRATELKFETIAKRSDLARCLEMDLKDEYKLVS